MNYLIVLFAALFMLPDVVMAAGDAATFESFYRTPSTIGWWFAVLAAALAVVVIIATGGTASPVVVWIGTLIGNAMGLSGAAATKAGLALLGGGSIVSGGWGMAGGIVFLTAALTFSTDVIVDYSVGMVVSEYQYRDLVQKSQKYTTLPVPGNTDGSAGYKAAVEKLKAVNQDQLLHAESNVAVIAEAIGIAKQASDDPSLEVEEQIRLAALISLLKFQKNDFKGAKDYAGKSLASASREGIPATLPAFIYASSGLYDEELHFDTLTDTHLRHAVLRESSNKLIPLLFSIYLDRTMLRIDQGDLGPDSLSRVFHLMADPALKDHLLSNLLVLATRYFVLLKGEQQRISVLATSSNDTLRNSPKTLLRVEQAMDYYGQLLADLEPVLDTLQRIIPRGIISLRNNDVTTRWEEFVQLRQEYLNDKDRLGGLISGLASYQTEQARLAEEARLAAELEQAILAAELEREQAREKARLVMWVVGLIVVVSVFLIVISRRRNRCEHRCPGS